MAFWNLVIYFNYRTHIFSITPNMNYNDLERMINNHYKIILENYLLEIYDLRFRRYVILNEEYIRKLQDRLPRTNIRTLNGRILIRKNTSRNYLSIDQKRRRTSSFSPQNDHLIIWLDSYIGVPENCRQLKRIFYLTTMLDNARSMTDYEICIDDLIQTNSQLINNRKHLNTFNNKDECLDFVKRVESNMKIIFITSNLFGEEIVPLIVKRVHMIYILVTNTLFSYDWVFDYVSSVLIFDEAICLLVRLTRDLAHEFVQKAQLTLSSSVKQTIVLLKWARKLYNRANEIDTPSYLPTLRSINHQLEKLEYYEEKEEKYALECDED